MELSFVNKYIEDVINVSLPDASSYPSHIVEAMNYAMTAGGKRVRPTLMYLVFRAFTDKSGEDKNSIYHFLDDKDTVIRPFLAAIEMIHTHSLIHDDLPALDNDSLRRGRPTVHVQFDESTAILAGDALLNNAYEVISNGLYVALKAFRSGKLLSLYSGNQSEKDRIGRMTAEGDIDLEVSFDELIYSLSENQIIMDEQDELELAGYELKLKDSYNKAFSILCSKTGKNGMLGGQGLDVELSGTRITNEQRDYIYKNKTSALIEAPLMIGAILAGADSVKADKLEEAGRSIGLAFQVQDDILDTVGDAEKLGKEVHQDERNEKNTYVSEYGIERSKEFVRLESEKAVSIIMETVPDNEYRTLLIQLVESMINRDR